MSFPEIRMRRLRNSSAMRRLVRETTLSVDDLVYPLFVRKGRGLKEPIKSMTDCFHFSPDTIADEAAEVASLGIPAVLLFGLPDKKNQTGSEAWADDGAAQQAINEIKKAAPELLVITDICLCAYTDTGHCGVIKDGKIDNDATCELLAKTALSHVQAGADMVAPSDMMDGRVGCIRRALDENDFCDIPIMAYSAKYASAFYGPFRDAVDSAPQFGDRSGHQMDPANAREGIKEAVLDMEEGADMIMVKPALAYLDIVRRVRERCLLPLAAYNVSGEYSMVKAAEERGWIDGTRVMMEMLTSIKRAGADLILTYFAKEAARVMNSGT